MTVNCLFKRVVLLTVILTITCQAHCYARKIGPFDLSFVSAIHENYDDNVTYKKDNAKRDFITKVDLGLEALYEGKTSQCQLKGNIQQNIFMDNSDFNNMALDLGGKFSHELSKRDRFSFSDTFRRYEDPRSFQDAFGSTAGRYRTQNNVFSTAYERDISSQFGILVRYKNAASWYSRTDLESSVLNTVGVEMDYYRSSTLSFYGAYDYLVRDFEHGSRATTNELGAGTRFNFTPQLSLDANAGIDFIDSYDGTSYKKPFYKLTLSDLVDENTRPVVSFTKSYSTTSYAKDVFSSWQILIGLVKQLSKRLGINGSVFYGEGEYSSSGNKDKFQGANIGLTYDIKDNVLGTITYAHSQVASNVFTREYTKNVVSVGMTIKF